MKGNKAISKRKIRNKKKTKKVGEPPGTLVYIGEKPKIQTKIRVIDYNKENYSIKRDVTPNKDLLDIEKNTIRWVYITGLTEVGVIEDIGKFFNLHPLVLEDILNTNQRPKFEDYTNYIFIVLKRIIWNEEKKEFENEQLSLILGPNFVISFSELESNIFNPILERIIKAKGRVRAMEADYLAYTLMDVIVDNYFIILDIIGEIIDNIEENLVKNPEPDVLQSIYQLKRNSIDLRRSIWPLRELINRLQREQSNLISDDLHIYLRDVYDHIFRISDSIENYRDIIFGMLDLYLSSVSNKMNDIMKVLTMISTIFIPLSFLAGFYGMNFIIYQNFQLDLFIILIIIMVIISSSMFLLFRKKKWI
ncbi:MAG: magnesium/cobalt transporter CorA [Promethearchaeota archaeon]|nr:MAG: magnesium/cobalt transporter CorA [Candidatus Lokiarchaeota archaeon]